jgi:hypothetical protein
MGPKRRSSGATQGKPKKEQPAMGPESIGSSQGKAICCEAQQSLSHLPQAKHNKAGPRGIQGRAQMINIKG